MQRLKTIWRDSPFSLQGLKSRWRQLLAMFSIALILIGLGYIWRFRSTPAAVTTDPFARLAAQQQERLSAVELSWQLERLKASILGNRDDEAIDLYTQVSLRLEETMTPERWSELEPHLTTLGGHLSRGYTEAEQEIDNIIALLIPTF